MSDTPLSPEQVKQAEIQASKEGYLHRSLVALDQFANVLTGGSPDETISARSQRLANQGNWVGKAMSWWLAKIQPSHGYKAEAGDAIRASTVLKTEDKALGVPPPNDP